MLDTIAFHEYSEFICCELGPIIANRLFWQAVCSEQPSQFLDCSGGACSGHRYHLECVSTTIRNIVPKNGPAKSMWMRCRGRAGHSHG